MIILKKKLALSQRQQTVPFGMPNLKNVTGKDALFNFFFNLIFYSSKWVGGGFTKSHIINYMDYLHPKKSNKFTNWNILNKYANSVININC